jgi:uncharacterized protein with GYD domain
MPKYLFHGSYTESGLKGLIKEGGTKRREAITKAVESIGGKLEVLYFAYGDNDFYFIADNPDPIGAITGSLLSNATGTVRLKTTILITPEEVDEAVKRTLDWRPPGQ